MNNKYTTEQFEKAKIIEALVFASKEIVNKYNEYIDLHFLEFKRNAEDIIRILEIEILNDSDKLLNEVFTTNISTFFSKDRLHS